MPRSTSRVNKLVRVLVVGGVALAGVPATAHADEKPAGEEQKTAKPAEKAQDAKAKDGKDKKAKEQAAKEKEAKEKAESEGGGVKGW